jgi:predicted XRE-type DNA-binding protein
MEKDIFYNVSYMDGSLRQKAYAVQQNCYMAIHLCYIFRRGSRVECPGCGIRLSHCGFPEPEATVHKMRSELMIEIEKMIRAQNLTQIQAARILHVTQARVSDLKRGKTEKFSLDMLVTFAARMGKSVRMRIAWPSHTT